VKLGISIPLVLRAVWQILNALLKVWSPDFKIFIAHNGNEDSATILVRDFFQYIL
jgi:hypothetical protein